MGIFAEMGDRAVKTFDFGSHHTCEMEKTVSLEVGEEQGE